LVLLGFSFLPIVCGKEDVGNQIEAAGDELII
jgi:hypothetical protein